MADGTLRPVVGSDERSIRYARIAGLTAILLIVIATVAGTFLPVSVEVMTLDDMAASATESVGTLLALFGVALVMVAVSFLLAFVILERRLPRPTHPANLFPRRDKPLGPWSLVLMGVAVVGTQVVLNVVHPPLPIATASGLYAANDDATTFVSVTAPVDLAAALVFAILFMTLWMAALVALQWVVAKFRGAPPEVGQRQPSLGADDQ
jgi:hypothetical protein